MIIKCNRKYLLSNINKLIKSIPTRTTFKVFKNIFIKIDNKITFYTVNSHFSTEIYDDESKIIEYDDNNIVISINGKTLYNIIKNLSGDTIEIKKEKDNSNLIIVEYGGNYSITKIPMDIEYLNTYQLEEENNSIISNFKIYNEQLKRMIISTIFSVSNDKSLEQFNGCLFDIKENKFNIVSTDGYRLSWVQNNLNKEFQLIDNKCIVPIKTLRMIKNIITKKGDTVTIIFNDKNISFETEKYKIVSNVIENSFIDYKKYFTEKINTKCILEKEQLKNTLKTIISLKNSKQLCVKLNIKNNMIITTDDEDISFKNEISFLDKEGNDLIIYFNPKYLLDVVNAIDNLDIFLFFGENKKNPLYICGTGYYKINYKYLILPIIVNK